MTAPATPKTPCPTCGSSARIAPVDGRGDRLHQCKACWTTFIDNSICATCCRNPATHEASSGDQHWPVCGRCREQSQRLGRAVQHRPIPTHLPKEGAA